MNPDSEVEVRKILAGGHLFLREWVSGYRYARTEPDGSVIVTHTGGLYEGMETRYPAEHVRLCVGTAVRVRGVYGTIARYEEDGRARVSVRGGEDRVVPASELFQGVPGAEAFPDFFGPRHNRPEHDDER